MDTRRLIGAFSLLAISSAAISCDAVDRMRNKFGTTDTLSVVTAAGTGLVLALQAPGVLRAGQEGVVRVSVNNRSDTVARNIRLELIVPGWVEPMPPRSGDREVTMAAQANGATRFSYRMDETPLTPGQTQFIQQRIRVPAAASVSQPDMQSSRVVRARLLGLNGEPLAEVQGEISLDAGAPSDTTATTTTEITTSSNQIGPLRLGMTAAELHRAMPSAHDTTWMQDGATQRGSWMPLANDGVTLAVFRRDSVDRLEVRGPAIRTSEHLGVGSTLDELRAAYGTACANASGGAVVVSFANAPGITFALDTPVPTNVAQLRANASRLPATARVTRWWIRRGADICGRQAGQATGG